jgi:hypothetical protein
MYRAVEWVDESSFRDDLIRIVGMEPHERFTVFHTDDDVFFRTFSPPELRDDEVCFSLRLGVNIVYCYPLDIPERAEGASLYGNRLRWAWREQEPGSFAYPLSLNGHVFRTTDIRRWLGEVTFDNPNELEASLQAVGDDLQAMMASYEHSVVASLPLNVVNDVYFNRSEWAFGVEELNERFFLGQRIDLEQTDFSHVASAHEQIVPVLSGEDASLAPIFAAWARERASWFERSQALARRLDEAESAKEWSSEQREAWEHEAHVQVRGVETLQAAVETLQAAVETLQAALTEQREVSKEQIRSIASLQAALTEATAPRSVRLRRWLRASIGR